MIGSNLLLSDDGYQINRSLRFRLSASAYLSRSISSTSNQKTYTFSCWIKRGQITAGTDQSIISSRNAGGNSVTYLYFNTSDKLHFFDRNSGMTIQGEYYTNAVFRDPSAWYHVVCVVDTTQATAANRFNIYVNGVQQTLTTSTAFAQNTTTNINSSGQGAFIGSMNPSYGAYLDGYLAEVNFIDGQALTPSSFGQTDPITGVWQAKKYAGTYGTNGFYLNFNDNSAATAAAIGKDYSGNGNNWTPNNISVTAGVTYDSMIDSPTVGYAASNYCVCNPILGYSSKITPTNANLTVTLGTGSNAPFGSRATFGVSSGKWYWETTITAKEAAAGEWVGVGIVADNVNWPSGNFLGANTGGYEYFNDGVKYGNGVSTAYGASYTVGDVVGVALDATNQTLVFYKNGVSQGTAFTSIGSSSLWVPAFEIYRSTGTTQTLDVNFGQRPFTYTPPSGFAALNTYNLPAATINNGATVMAASTYTGNGTGARSITNSGNNAAGVSFKPDFVWQKDRSIVNNHQLYDSVRGVGKRLISNTTDSEATNPVNGYLSSFDSNGVSSTPGSTDNSNWNNNGDAFVIWQWQAGQGTTSSNTNGSITSTVSVNQSAGFSVVTFNAGASGAQSFGHGLGVAPKMVILKDRANAIGWNVYHASVCTTTSQYLQLNTTGGLASIAGAWGSALPTSSVVGFGSGTVITANANGVAYCWSEVAGYSKFSSYTGNGSADGPFVYCGFRPRWIMRKRTDSSVDGSWLIVDTSRDLKNSVGNYLFAESSATEGATTDLFDILSNGFKLRSTSGNNSGGTYIYAAFAENPFKYALAR